MELLSFPLQYPQPILQFPREAGDAEQERGMSVFLIPHEDI